MEKKGENMPILKISFSGSDSAQNWKVEPPGMALGALNTSGFWALGSRAAARAVMRRLVRVRKR